MLCCGGISTHGMEHTSCGSASGTRYCIHTYTCTLLVPSWCRYTSVYSGPCCWYSICCVHPVVHPVSGMSTGCCRASTAGNTSCEHICNNTSWGSWHVVCVCVDVLWGYVYHYSTIYAGTGTGGSIVPCGSIGRIVHMVLQYLSVHLLGCSRYRYRHNVPLVHSTATHNMY
jgi:hypothetical protein